MILVFPQATISFNNLLIEMIQKSKATLFLDKSFSSYNMSKISTVVIIILENKVVENFLNTYLSNSHKFVNYEIVILKNETSGSICSTLMAIPFLQNRSVIISALDQIIIDKEIDFNNLIDIHREVIVPTVKSNNPLLCYTIKDDFGNVIQLFEKKIVSRDAILGIYYFKNFSDFAKSCYELLIKYKGFKNRVFYNSDVINNLLMHDYKIYFPNLELNYTKVKSLKNLEKIL